MKNLVSAAASLTALALATVSAAAELHAVSGVRPDHEQRFSSLRVSIDQLHAAAVELEALAVAEQPENPDAQALQALRDDLAAARTAASQAVANGDELGELTARIETLALVVDRVSDQVAELVAAKAA